MHYGAVVGKPVPVAIVLAFGGMMLVSWYLLASMCLASTRLFRELHAAHARLESGDFDVHMTPVGADEGTQLAAQFNDTAREVGRIVAAIRDAAAEGAHATVELKGNATLVAEATSQQEQSTTHMAAAGSQAISHSSSEVVSLARAIGDVSQLMDQLAQRSAEVGQSAGVIREISDQTNLLALNAAIEAAQESAAHASGATEALARVDAQAAVESTLVGMGADARTT